MRTRADLTIIGRLLAGLIVAAAGFALPACSKPEPVRTVSVPTVPPPPPPAAPAPAKEKPVYVYSGDHFRDPFVPSGQTGGYQADAVFDPAKMSVKGIIYGAERKTAVLATGGGLTYFVKGGKIFDIMGKPIEGFTAKVYAEKVVVTGEGNNVFELKIRNTQEEKAL